MRVPRILAITLLALLLFTTSDAKRGGGGGRSRSSSRRSGGSRGSYSFNRYSGVVIIAGPNGTYYQGYGDSCPYGCAVDGRCGSEEECKMSFENYFVIGIAITFGLCFLYSCITNKNDENSY